MGMMDSIKDKMSGDDMQDRYNHLLSKEQAGELDDQGREELSMLRSHFEK